MKVRTLDAFPPDWANTQNNLAVAYSERLRGDKADNLEQAIICFKKALKVRTLDDFPQDWAITNSNLGGAYCQRIRGNKADNLEQAIICFEEALKVRTLDGFPQDWASTQDNLGNAYFFRIKGDKTDNLERAIVAYTESLKVRTFDNFPQDWASTQNNLGNAYLFRIKGDKANNLKQAIKFYHNALKIRTIEDTPLDCLLTARNLAILYYTEKQWQPATEAYHVAIKAVENARLEALNPQSRQEVLSNAIDIFHGIVQAHLNLNQPEKALEYIERSKGRNLVELMTQKNLQPQGVSQEIIEQLNELKQKVVNEKMSLQSQSINQKLMRSDNLTPYVQDQNYLKQYQQELDSFIEREIKPIDPLFSLTQKVEPIPFTKIKALTDAETCLLQWYITGEKILAFVVSANGDIKVWQSSEDERNQLGDAIINYVELYYSETGKTEWINQLSNLLQTFADILNINDILALIPYTCKRLIIIPHWFLHILPLHAFPISNSHILKFGAGANAQDLHDLFPNGVQYAPSCQLLQIAQSFHHSDFNKLFAIQNPTKDLLYTDLEVNILSNFFTESQIIAKDNATKNTIITHLKSSNNHCHHFSCHGGFNPNNPLKSALFLANQEPLTLGEIFELRLNQCRLVTLSACETGLIDPKSISDEYIGLPSGFLFAGSPSVVSSLWTVNDLSTSFLMIKFYEILFDVNLNISVAVALKEAQDWLQNLTIEKLDEFLEQYQSQIDKYLAPLRPGQRTIYQESLKQIRQRQPHPFANPYYWAGFTATGI
ncbi:CHAT domain-containing protein [Argonema antarcticum]|uniref:CHAT domain-containing protein n=1 Tax=Argonema antarcticum TaxID=2942763 RepID=UPI002012298F|nr:CHAT domain-containing tetratricopeptide repeat protein [Argonema antarcticum]MCL1472062.1 CHAT domain-containing protein [Argonema antarcticum A004/B2]